jgi:hypothetical protein
MPQMPAKGASGERGVREKGERFCLQKRLTSHLSNNKKHPAIVCVVRY